MRTANTFGAALALAVSACGSPAADDGASHADAGNVDGSDHDASVKRSKGVNGWIIMSGLPKEVSTAISVASDYGVNHVELAEGIVTNIEDLLGSNFIVDGHVKIVNDAVKQAHAKGLRAYIWAHELSGISTTTVCYDPADPLWEARRQAYRDGLAKIPDIDGVVLMYGSAPTGVPGTQCTCAWCQEKYPGVAASDAPPNDERIRLVTEVVGGVVERELGKELIGRVFVHAPEEIAWQSGGYAAIHNLPFVTMNKSDVQDWQPYNPPDPSFGQMGADHPGILELDAAGEYYGVSVLPFCAPEYFRYRLQTLWAHGGVGAAVRVERDLYTSLGTPNEIDLLAIGRMVADPSVTSDAVWDEFLDTRYDLAASNPARARLREVLGDTFAVRLKSHYVLGIWALDKDSDLPDSAALGEFNGRGNMPEWDPAWAPVWDALNAPDRATVARVWQEGYEAVQIATDDLATCEADLAGQLAQKDYDDLHRRFLHQLYAARAWRAEKLFIWAERARGTSSDAELASWSAWARAELDDVASAMDADGLDNVPIASPARIRAFLGATADPPGAVAAMPGTPTFSAARTTALTPTAATVRVSLSQAGAITAEWGLEVPTPDHSQALGNAAAAAPVDVVLDGLQPDHRYVVQFRAMIGGVEYRSGYHWLFTPPG